ncbi:MAG TPA: hypothetical protein PKY80_07060, partial [Syntrophales bacterium]|nr:hypothetical protein [Syntrophales bacterium]
MTQLAECFKEADSVAMTATGLEKAHMLSIYQQAGTRWTDAFAGLGSLPYGKTFVIASASIAFVQGTAAEMSAGTKPFYVTSLEFNFNVADTDEIARTDVYVLENNSLRLAQKKYFHTGADTAVYGENAINYVENYAAAPDQSRVLESITDYRYHTKTVGGAIVPDDNYSGAYKLYKTETFGAVNGSNADPRAWLEQEVYFNTAAGYLTNCGETCYNAATYGHLMTATVNYTWIPPAVSGLPEYYHTQSHGYSSAVTSYTNYFYDEVTHAKVRSDNYERIYPPGYGYVPADLVVSRQHFRADGTDYTELIAQDGSGSTTISENVYFDDVRVPGNLLYTVEKIPGVNFRNDASDYSIKTLTYYNTTPNETVVAAWGGEISSFPAVSSFGTLAMLTVVYDNPEPTARINSYDSSGNLAKVATVICKYGTSYYVTQEEGYELYTTVSGAQKARMQYSKTKGSWGYIWGDKKIDLRVYRPGTDLLLRTESYEYTGFQTTQVRFTAITFFDPIAMGSSRPIHVWQQPGVNYPAPTITSGDAWLEFNTWSDLTSVTSPPVLPNGKELPTSSISGAYWDKEYWKVTAKYVNNPDNGITVPSDKLLDFGTGKKSVYNTLRTAIFATGLMGSTCGDGTSFRLKFLVQKHKATVEQYMRSYGFDEDSIQNFIDYCIGGWGPEAPVPHEHAVWTRGAMNDSSDALVYSLGDIGNPAQLNVALMLHVMAGDDLSAYGRQYKIKVELCDAHCKDAGTVAVSATTSNLTPESSFLVNNPGVSGNVWMKLTWVDCTDQDGTENCSETISGRTRSTSKLGIGWLMNISKPASNDSLTYTFSNQDGTPNNNGGNVILRYSVTSGRSITVNGQTLSGTGICAFTVPTGSSIYSLAINGGFAAYGNGVSFTVLSYSGNTFTDIAAARRVINGNGGALASPGTEIGGLGIKQDVVYIYDAAGVLTSSDTFEFINHARGVRIQTAYYSKGKVYKTEKYGTDGQTVTSVTTFEYDAGDEIISSLTLDLVSNGKTVTLYADN